MSTRYCRDMAIDNSPLSEGDALLNIARKHLDIAAAETPGSGIAIEETRLATEALHSLVGKLLWWAGDVNRELGEK